MDDGAVHAEIGVERAVVGALHQTDAVIGESRQLHRGDHGDAVLGDEHLTDVLLTGIELVLEAAVHPEVRVERAVRQQAPQRGHIVRSAVAHGAAHHDAAVGQLLDVVRLVGGEVVVLHEDAVRPERGVHVAVDVQLHHGRLEVAHAACDPAVDDRAVIEHQHVLGVFEARALKRREQEGAPILEISIQRALVLGVQCGCNPAQ